MPLVRCLSCSWIALACPGDDAPARLRDGGFDGTTCYRCAGLDFEEIDEAAAPPLVTVPLLRVRKPA